MNNQIISEPNLDPEDTQEIVTLTKLDNVCITVTMIGPDMAVHNVMRGSYVHRVMLANGYKEVKS